MVKLKKLEELYEVHCKSKFEKNNKMKTTVDSRFVNSLSYREK